MRPARDSLGCAVVVSVLLVLGTALERLHGPCTASARTPTSRATTADFFVSPKGKDRWPGRLADPGENDGPFATVARARQAAGARVKTGNREDGEPLFRFLQIADTHVYEGPPHATNHCALANEKMKWVVETVATGKHFPVPDFVIHTGDMIDGEPQSAGVKLLGPDLRLLKEMIRPLRCPFHPCVGNHENQQQEGSAAFERPYREAFAADQVNYAFRHGPTLPMRPQRRTRI